MEVTIVWRLLWYGGYCSESMEVTIVERGLRSRSGAMPTASMQLPTWLGVRVGVRVSGQG